MKVKICGIQTGEDAQAAVRLGADALGFVFADSKRQVTPADVRTITEDVPNACLKVGVFVNEHPLIVKEIAGFCGLDAIQLHGDEYTADYEIIGLPIIRSISVNAGKNVFLQKYGKADYYLLDTGGGKARGGMGVAFDWRQVRGIGLGDEKVILAGGLNPANVGEAVQIVHPNMVDVSSGVETGGAKNPILMKAFIEAVKREEML